MGVLKEYDVVIIGCGIAGLSAGMRLLELNPSYRIAFIEARDRVGGRTEIQNLQISSDPTQTVYSVDVGGQWLGPTHKKMLSLVTSLGMNLLEQEYPDPPVSCSSTRLVECAHYSFPPLSTEAQKDVKNFYIFFQDSIDKMDPSKPFDYPDAKHLDTISAFEVVEEVISTDEAKDEIYFYLQTVLAVSPSSCSWLFFLFYVASGGGIEALGDGEQGAQKYKIKGGAGRVCQLMMQKLFSDNGLTNPSLYLQYAVRLIEQNAEIIGTSDYFVNSSCNDKYPVSITAVSTSSNNESSLQREIQFQTQRVIVAVPITTLCNKNLTFKPALPECKLLLGREICPGRVFKVIVCYPQGTVFGFGECRPLRDLGLVHNVFATSSIGEYPSLIGLITGPAADEFKQLDDKNKRKVVLSQYASMYALEETIEPVAFIIRDWNKSEKYSGGCFAGIFPPSKNATFANNFKALKMPHGRIHFAGTETSEYFYGYMEGARRSGLRAAEEVYKLLPPV